jgi:hypothetical protein
MANSRVAINETHTQLLSAVKRVEEKLSCLERQIAENFSKAEAGLFHGQGGQPEKQNLSGKSAPQKVMPAARNLSVENSRHNFFPEHLLDLPLLVRRQDGSYAAAGGEKHGPVSLRGVSAILEDSARTSRKYALLWEQNRQGDWIILAEEGAHAAKVSDELRFTIHEITSAKGIKVLEIRNCLHNNEPCPGTVLVDFLSAV